MSSYLGFVIGGYLLGSILFAYVLPKLTRHIDIREMSEDGNPGTYRRVTNKATPVSAQSSLYEEALLAAAADKIPMEVRLRPMYSKDSKE